MGEPTPFVRKPTLTGASVTLRPIRAEDADLVDALLREDPEIARLTGNLHSSTEACDGPPLDRLRESYGRWAVAEDRLVLAVIDTASGLLVGEAVLNDWDEDNRSCGFRILVGVPGRGRNGPGSRGVQTLET